PLPIQILHKYPMDKLRERRNLFILGVAIATSGLALYYMLSKKKKKLTIDQQLNLDRDKLHIINRIKDKYHISYENMVKIKGHILSEFQLGLQKVDGESQSSIKMLPTFITKKPNGTE